MWEVLLPQKGGHLLAAQAMMAKHHVVPVRIQPWQEGRNVAHGDVHRALDAGNPQLLRLAAIKQDEVPAAPLQLVHTSAGEISLPIADLSPHQEHARGPAARLICPLRT